MVMVDTRHEPLFVCLLFQGGRYLVVVVDTRHEPLFVCVLFQGGRYLVVVVDTRHEPLFVCCFRAVGTWWWWSTPAMSRYLFVVSGRSVPGGGGRHPP